MNGVGFMLSLLFISFILIFYAGITIYVVYRIALVTKTIKRKNLTLTKRSRKIIILAIILASITFIISLIAGNYVISCGLIAFSAGMFAVFKNIGATIEISQIPLFKLYYIFVCLSVASAIFEITLGRMCFKKCENKYTFCPDSSELKNNKNYGVSFDKIVPSGNIEVKNE